MACWVREILGKNKRKEGEEMMPYLPVLSKKEAMRDG